ncbi:CLUMA_CG000857, isoform A [Clunio marinus]|uniref:CLUMA_CG000857, isoform A n=1 Tax=Clunio marinus TaxID=568069 RepID=A0A1J1HHU3_9DIPT|nr:CLUMA_CG000857, isoform A [Clunio marinus]
MFRKILTIFIILPCAINSFQSHFTFTNGFGHCLKQDKPNLITCAGQQALEALQHISSISNFTLTEGVIFSKDETLMGRSSPINFLDQDPNDFRSLLENAGAVMSERSLQWDMSRFIPGLQLRVGPSITGGLLEFVIDPNSQYDERSHGYQEESTARIMTKKFVLPFLLGLKFNLATLLPLILGAIILISKKAAFLSKLALFISGFFGLGGIATLGSLGSGLGGGGYGGGGYGGYGYASPIVHQPVGVYKVLEINTPRTEEEEAIDHFYDYDKKHLLKDRASRLHERKLDPDKYLNFKPQNQRSFAWATNPN